MVVAKAENMVPRNAPNDTAVAFPDGQPQTILGILAEQFAVDVAEVHVVVEDETGVYVRRSEGMRTAGHFPRMEGMALVAKVMATSTPADTLVKAALKTARPFTVQIPEALKDADLTCLVTRLPQSGLHMVLKIRAV